MVYKICATYSNLVSDGKKKKTTKQFHKEQWGKKTVITDHVFNENVVCYIYIMK